MTVDDPFHSMKLHGNDIYSMHEDYTRSSVLMHEAAERPELSAAVAAGVRQVDDIHGQRGVVRQHAGHRFSEAALQACRDLRARCQHHGRRTAATRQEQRR